MTGRDTPVAGTKGGRPGQQATRGLGRGRADRSGALHGRVADRRDMAGAPVQPGQVQHQRPAGCLSTARLVPHRLLRPGRPRHLRLRGVRAAPRSRRGRDDRRVAPWMLAVSALVLGNSSPQIPCRLADPGCTANYQLHSAGGLTDAVVASIAFAVLAITPFPLWRRLAALPRWRRLKPVMMAAHVLGPVFFVLLAVSSNMASMPANGLIERLLVSTFVLWTSALAINLIVTSRRAGVPGARVPTVLGAVPGDGK